MAKLCIPKISHININSSPSVVNAALRTLEADLADAEKKANAVRHVHPETGAVSWGTAWELEELTEDELKAELDSGKPLSAAAVAKMKSFLSK